LKGGKKKKKNGKQNLSNLSSQMLEKNGKSNRENIEKGEFY